MEQCQCGQKLINYEPNHLKVTNRGYKRIAIVGKGLTAPFYEHSHDAYIALNDAIYIVEAAPLYLLKADVGTHCTQELPECTAIVPKHVLPNNPDALWFDWADLGLNRRTCTLCCALSLANLWGAECITMYGFDKLLNSEWGEYFIANPRNSEPLGDQKPMLRELPNVLLEKCWLMDRIHHLVKLTELLYK